jgi:hypothetical protein
MFGNVQLAAAASNLSSGFLTKSMKHNSPRLNVLLIAQQLKGSDRRSLPAARHYATTLPFSAVALVDCKLPHEKAGRYTAPLSVNLM